MLPKLSRVLAFITAWTLLPINLHTQVYSLGFRSHMGRYNNVGPQCFENVEQYSQLHNSAASFPPKLRLSRITFMTLSAASLNNANDGYDGYEAPVNNLHGPSVSSIPDYSLDGDFANQNPLEESSAIVETKVEYSHLRSENSSLCEESSIPLMISDFHMTIREDKKDQIRHMEFYLKKERGGGHFKLLIRVWMSIQTAIKS